MVSAISIVPRVQTPWTKAIYRRDPTPLHRWLHARREAAVVRGANLVISTSEPTSKDFRVRYPDQTREKFVCLPNGFDPDEFGCPERALRLPLRLIHAGNLTLDRNIDDLLEAMRRVNRDGVLCRLELAGQVAGRTLEKIRELGLEEGAWRTTEKESAGVEVAGSSQEVQ